MAQDRELIEIQDGMMRHIRRSVLSEAPLDAIAGHLVQRIPALIPILPRTPVRSLLFDGERGNGAVLLEAPAARRHINVLHRPGSAYTEDAVRSAASPDMIGRFHVMFPYTYFLFGFGYDQTNLNSGSARHLSVSASLLFWARQPIRTPEDELSLAHCPNVDSGAGICWGGNTTDNSTFSMRLDDMVQNFWDSTFNEDLGHMTPFDHSISEWERHSEDPLEWPSWNYWQRATTRTVAEAMQLVVGSFDPAQALLANLDPEHVTIPEAPRNFTVGRAHEWLTSLPESARQRLMVATTLLDTPEAPEA